jgi:hypothetical protein
MHAGQFLALGLIVAGLLPVATPNARAQFGPFSITPMYGYRDGGRFAIPEQGLTRRLDGSVSAAVAFGYEIEPGRYYEFLYSQQRSAVASTDLHADVSYIQVGGRIDWPGGHLVPYVSGALGATRIKARNGDSASTLRPGMSFAGGMEWPFGERVALRVEARGYLTLTSGQRGILCVSESGHAFCKLAYRGDVLGQVELLGGLTMRF